MSKFFSVPGMAPSGGEGNMGGRFKRMMTEMPTQEQVEARNPDYYKNRSDTLDSPFGQVGEKYKFRGDDAVIRHVEQNSDGTQDMTVQRSSRIDSGSYKLTVSKDAGRKQVISKVKRTFE